ncbi:MAG: hypothetical protein ABIA75_07045 [Candidatus Neomarinimicrobiota bacterium]
MEKLHWSDIENVGTAVKETGFTFQEQPLQALPAATAADWTNFSGFGKSP